MGAGDFLGVTGSSFFIVCCMTEAVACTGADSSMDEMELAVAAVAVENEDKASVGGGDVRDTDGLG